MNKMFFFLKTYRMESTIHRNERHFRKNFSMYEIILFFISIFAGALGAILGIGGGIVIVPVLTLLMGVEIRYAIAASLVSIIATSTGAAASFLKDHLTNSRVAIFLETGTVAGAITGVYVMNFINPNVLYFLFSAFLLFSATMMLFKRHESWGKKESKLSKKLNFSSEIYDGATLKTYYVENPLLGLFFMFIAGMLSSLLGIGSGVLKVLAMDNAMKIPIKVSSATSNFMIGVTAVAGASIYLMRGEVHPEIVTPVALGVLLGSWIGAKLMLRMSTNWIKNLFVILLLLVASQMFLKGL